MALCVFTFDHYDEILRQADEKYRFSKFTTRPDEAKRIYLRHDVDVSLENAVKLAELEAERGMEATYFVAINSPYYNLFNDTQIKRVREIANLGHTIGIHIDERGEYMTQFNSIREAVEATYEYLSRIVPVEKVLSFHMPSEYEFTRTERIGDFVNVYSTTFNDGDIIKYLSDSNRNWREGCFCQHLEDPSFDSYQVLTHPIWWHEEQISSRELYKKIQVNNQMGLEVNLKSDLQIFSEL